MPDTETPVVLEPYQLYSGNPETDVNAEPIYPKVLADGVLNQKLEPVFGSSSSLIGYVRLGTVTGEASTPVASPAGGIMDKNDPNKVYEVDNLVDPSDGVSDAIWTASKITQVIKEALIIYDEDGNGYILGFQGNTPGFIKVVDAPVAES